MNFKCIVKRVGTLIYSRTSDPLKCLSLALHDLHSDPDISQMASTQRQPNPETILREAGNILNDIVHDEIRKLKQTSPLSI